MVSETSVKPVERECVKHTAELTQPKPNKVAHMHGGDTAREKGGNIIMCVIGG